MRAAHPKPARKAPRVLGGPAQNGPSGLYSGQAPPKPGTRQHFVERCIALENELIMRTRERDDTIARLAEADHRWKREKEQADGFSKRIYELDVKLANERAVSARLDQFAENFRETLEQFEQKEHTYKQQLAAAESRWRTGQELLRRARDLLIHEKIDAQMGGHENGFARNVATGAKVPVGWRTNGIGELIEQIEQYGRGDYR